MWLLILYYDKNKKEQFKSIEINTIKELSYLLDMKPTEISNFYHGLIYSRGPLDYCHLFKISEFIS
tara:strand:- start:5027 stop:5224 length:198 start_codon:yes stop_codon:yes gene_type:complete